MFELNLLCPEERVETVSDALDALEALSVSVEDADAHTDAEQALFGEPGMPAPREGWQRSRITALFPTQEAAEEAWQLLQAQDFFEGCIVQGVSVVQEQDWSGSRNPSSRRWTSRPISGSCRRGTRCPRLRAAASAWIRDWPWHGNPPNHAHVPALDCQTWRRGRAGAGARARLWLRLRHPGDRRREIWRHRDRRGGH